MRPFKDIRIPKVGRSIFDLSYNKMLTCDMGQLIPIMCDEVIPGDKWKLGNELVIRFQPMVAPVLHEINAFVHYFFVPYRLLWEDWEEFITGGVDGTNADTLPRWNSLGSNAARTAVGTLWDYLGFPTGIDPTDANYYPMDFPRRAYYLIWNEYYRDQNLQNELDITDQANYTILNRCWTKDFFTSALLTQQRGVSPVIPIVGTPEVDVDSSIVTDVPGTQEAVYIQSGARFYVGGAGIEFIQALEDNIDVLLSNVGLNISDVRLAFQTQRFLERNARAGARYTEFLKAHFGVSPRDDRLQRPEYLGGNKSPIIISEVLQTSKSETGAPQGKLAGHGISASQGYCGSYYATEFGLIMGILSVMPVPAYQQGINRQFLRVSRYDFPFPEFVNLSEQQIKRGEIWTQTSGNANDWGYQGRYDELRYKPNQVCGLMRTTFNYWHLGRIFDSEPTLDSTFVTCNPSKRIFASTSDPGLIVHVGNKITAIRPIPVVAEPGMLDH